MSSEDIKILYENEMYVVCIKPSGSSLSRYFLWIF